MLGSRKALLRLAAVVGAGLLVLGGAPAIAADPEDRNLDFVEIAKNSQFNAAHGVRSGSGTADDPYVISGWTLSFLDIHDTSKHVVIRDNTIDNLILNWIDDGVKVYNNNIGDLRVNENVPRTGEPTTGLITNNDIGIVGQLRHYDGTFSNNVVDPGADMWEGLPFFGQQLAVAFDGFNGAHFTKNTVHGAVRAQLHGHHHSTGYGEHSHQHAMSHDDMDHTARWHQVYITDNLIYSDGEYALMYTDVAHSANDRTANSEENEDLNKPHIHHTKVFMNGNKLVGGGLVVDVFNASDERHTGTALGNIEIRGNDITLPAPKDFDLFEFHYAGIDVSQAKDVNIEIMSNKVVRGVAENSIDPSKQFINSVAPAISLGSVTLGKVFLIDNLVANHEIGIQARNFKKVSWWVMGLETENVGDPVSYDESVGEPKRKS